MQTPFVSDQGWEYHWDREHSRLSFRQRKRPPKTLRKSVSGRVRSRKKEIQALLMCMWFKGSSSHSHREVQYDWELKNNIGELPL